VSHPAPASSAPRVWRRRSLRVRLAAWIGWLAGTAVVIQCWRSVSQRTSWEFIPDAPRQAADLLMRMAPPDFPYVATLAAPLWATLTIATLGTMIAIAVAAPIALLAARNTTPHALVRPPALVAIVFSRSINSLLWALVLVAVIGPGPLAGVLAIALRSIGFIAKLLYEAIEEIDPRPVEAIAATGAGPAQALAWGVVPQVAPAFSGISLFRWDINVREATVVGLVGAGGIGLQLDAAISALQWQRASGILLVILVLVIGSESVSARLRRMLI
jgi:phosphonate transport system permease protein